MNILWVGYECCLLSIEKVKPAFILCAVKDDPDGEVMGEEAPDATVYKPDNLEPVSAAQIFSKQVKSGEFGELVCCDVSVKWLRIWVIQ